MYTEPEDNTSADTRTLITYLYLNQKSEMAFQGFARGIHLYHNHGSFVGLIGNVFTSCFFTLQFCYHDTVYFDTVYFGIPIVVQKQHKTLFIYTSFTVHVQSGSNLFCPFNLKLWEGIGNGIMS